MRAWGLSFLRIESYIKCGRKTFFPGILFKSFWKHQGPNVAKDILHLVPNEVGGEKVGSVAGKTHRFLGREQPLRAASGTLGSPCGGAVMGT